MLLSPSWSIWAFIWVVRFEPTSQNDCHSSGLSSKSLNFNVAKDDPGSVAQRVKHLRQFSHWLNRIKNHLWLRNCQKSFQMPRYVRNRQAVEEKSEQLNDFLTRKKSRQTGFGVSGVSVAPTRRRTPGFRATRLVKSFFLAFLFLLIRSSWIDSSWTNQELMRLKNLRVLMLKATYCGCWTTMQQ